MNTMPLSEIAERCGGSLVAGEALAQVRGVSKDTRSIRAGDVYLALKGENFDGHAFVQKAAEAGAVGAVVSELPDCKLPSSFGVLLVKDTLAALQHLAGSWRRELRGTVVALTGSSGKTSTKEFLEAVLSESGDTTATAGNLNNHIGLPLSILSAAPTDQFVILEIGMNHPGEIAPLSDLAAPHHSLITNIGTAHIEFLGSREGIAAEKSELFRRTDAAGKAVYPAWDDFAETLAESAGNRARPVWLDRGEPRAENIRHTAEGTEFALVAGGESHGVRLPVAGLHMVGNALLAAAIGIECGIAPEKIARALGAAKLSGGRLERKQIAGMWIFDDTYNANPDSMEAALDTLRAFPSNGHECRKIAVLGRMGELGHYASEGYRRVGRKASSSADILVVVGTEAGELAAEATASGLQSLFSVPDNAAAAVLLRSIGRPGDAVLVKGSRAARMEEILKQLS